MLYKRHSCEELRVMIKLQSHPTIRFSWQNLPVEGMKNNINWKFSLQFQMIALLTNNYPYTHWVKYNCTFPKSQSFSLRPRRQLTLQQCMYVCTYYNSIEQVGGSRIHLSAGKVELFCTFFDDRKL